MIGPHCGDSAENKREEALARAAGFVRLRHGAIEIGLLLGDGIFGALDLIGAAGIGRALVEGCQLALQAAANHIGSLRIGNGLALA